MNVGREVSLLVRMSAKQLRLKYFEVFGEENNSRNKAWLVKRITWRMTLDYGWLLPVGDGLAELENVFGESLDWIKEECLNYFRNSGYATQRN
jgi:hypothetical protein